MGTGLVVELCRSCHFKHFLHLHLLRLSKCLEPTINMGLIVILYLSVLLWWCPDVGRKPRTLRLTHNTTGGTIPHSDLMYSLSAYHQILSTWVCKPKKLLCRFGICWIYSKPKPYLLFCYLLLGGYVLYRNVRHCWISLA